jgi:hypothetical protein
MAVNALEGSPEQSSISDSAVTAVQAVPAPLLAPKAPTLGQISSSSSIKDKANQLADLEKEISQTD